MEKLNHSNIELKEYKRSTKKFKMWWGQGKNNEK